MTENKRGAKLSIVTFKIQKCENNNGGNSSRPQSQTLHVSPHIAASLFPSILHLSLSLRSKSQTTAMETHPLDSPLTTLTTPDSEKAWHLLALLLSLGRSARPSELASRCTSFPASTHLVQRLCSIANSPLSLSEDLYVTPSLLAVTALAEAVSCSGAGGALRTCLGKRKRVVLDCGFVPSAKRRLIVDFENCKFLLLLFFPFNFALFFLGVNLL